MNDIYKNIIYLETLMPQTMKLLGSTKHKITKDKNAEITEVKITDKNY